MSRVATTQVPVPIKTDAEGYVFSVEHNHRLTPCCHAVPTYHDDVLCCKVCWEEVDEALLFSVVPV